MTLLWLFLEFFKTGLFAIGGGMATLPFLYEMADKYPWFDTNMLSDMIAVSESTPGPVGINMATYAGYMADGVIGSLTATLSLVLPSIVIIIFVAKVLDKFNENKLVKGAFLGLKPLVAGLIAAASVEIFKIGVLNLELYSNTQKIVDIFNIKAILLFIITLIAIRKTKKHPIIFIVTGAVVGILLKM